VFEKFEGWASKYFLGFIFTKNFIKIIGMAAEVEKLIVHEVA